MNYPKRMINSKRHLFTVLFKHPQLKALVQFVLLQLPQLQGRFHFNYRKLFLWNSVNCWMLYSWFCKFWFVRIWWYFLVRLNNRLGGLFLSQFGGLFSPLSAVAGWSKRKYSLNSFNSAVYCFVFSMSISFSNGITCSSCCCPEWSWSSSCMIWGIEAWKVGR